VRPEIQTERLLLRLPPVTAADAVAAYLERNRTFHAPWSPHTSESYYAASFWREQLERDESAFDAGDALRFCLFERGEPSGRVVGRAHFSSFMRGPFQACFLGYDLDEAVQGRGYMSEALPAAIAFVFNELGLHRVMAGYIPTNERSGRLLRRLGFTVEGYARDYLLIAGRWQDHILTALVNPAP
jgi:ribosomal-protein-alanine N-acetyltransferase